MNYREQLDSIYEDLKPGQFATLDHDDKAYFDGYSEVHDCTVTVLESIKGKYETVEEYEITLDWDTIVKFHNGEE